MTPKAHMRLFIIAAALLIVVPAVSAQAERFNPDDSPNPTACVIDQETLLQHSPRVVGRTHIPDVRAGVLIQPRGRTWDYFHEVLLHRGGAVVIGGALVVLSPAYLMMGRLRIAAGRSGIKVLRFK